MNQPPNDDVEDSQVGNVYRSNETVPDLVPDSVDEDDPVPELVSDSDDEEEIEHKWTEVSLSSLPLKQRKKFGHLIGQCFLERDKKTIIPFVWKIDGFSRPAKDPNGKLYFRYFNAQFPKPRKYADFEYTQPRYLQLPTFQFTINMKIRTHLQRVWCQLGMLNLVVNQIRRSDEEVQDLRQSQPESHTSSIERLALTS